MIMGKPGDWYQDKYVGGYFNAAGCLVVCEEYGFSDADADRCAVQIQNGEGYYDTNGKYVSYEKDVD